jgi:hypothetical protein
MSYCAFWISKLKVTARIVLAILTVFITMETNELVFNYLPPLSYTSVLEDFSLGVEIFALVTAV